MSYLVLCAVALAVVLAVAASALALRRPARPARAALAALAAFAVLFVLTALFDSLMIAAGLMEYTAAHLLGWFVWLAPVEDFAYPLAAVILLPSLWLLVGPRRRGPRVAGAGDGR